LYLEYTVPYKLSEAEARLYREVTDYVREEFNRAEALANDKRAGTVGFARCVDESVPILRAPESIESFTTRLDQAQGTKGLDGSLGHRLGKVETSFARGGEREVNLSRQLQCAAQTRITFPAIRAKRQPTCQRFDGIGYLDILGSLAGVSYSFPDRHADRS